MHGGEESKGLSKMVYIYVAQMPCVCFGDGHIPHGSCYVTSSWSALISRLYRFGYHLMHTILFLSGQSKVHIWAGISMRGRTGICIGIMDAESYVSTLRQALLPLLREVYPDGHRSMQDNNPKHTSRRAGQFFQVL